MHTVPLGQATPAEQVVLQFIDHPDPEDSDEPTCGPGPFSMGNPNTV